MLTGNCPRVVFASIIVLAIGSFQTLSQSVTHGPFVGAVTASSARVYVRTSSPASVQVELSESSIFSSVVRSEQKNTTSDSDFVALLAVTGLKADSKYFYRLTLNGSAQSDVRTFKTFPSPGTAERFKFTFGSCQQSGRAEDFGAPTAGLVFERMAVDSPKFFLQIGDWTYPDTAGDMLNPIDYALDYANVQASYRNKYHPNYRMQQLLRIAPVDYVYDDHDFGYNNSDGASAPPQALTNSLRGYRELFPGYPLPNPQGGIWHKFTSGNCDFFMVDLRTRRDTNSAAFSPQFFDPPRLINPFPIPPVKLSPRPGHSILAGVPVSGENQRDWLLHELRQTTAQWKFIVSSVPFNMGIRRVIDSSLAYYNRGTYSVTDPVLGTIPVLLVAFEVSDKWAGFPEDAQALLRVVLTNRIKNVIVLSGDIHTAGIDDGKNAGFPELVAGGLDIANSKSIQYMKQVGIDIFNKGAQDTTNNNFNKAYGRVTVFGSDSVRLEVIDEFGVLVATHTVQDGFLPSPTTAIAEELDEVPSEFALHQNYPNPFNPTTTFEFSLPGPRFATLKVYNILGEPVATLVEGNLPAGTHRTEWNASRLATGVYLYKLQTADFIETRKLVLLK